MSAKSAVLLTSGSHYVQDDHGAADGVSKETVYLYFSATWRSKPVIVSMQADRYAASFFDDKTDTSSNRLTDWRVYATGARYGEEVHNRHNGEETTGTARAALSKLCEPLVMAWLDTDEYTASFQRAVGRMIMRHFRDHYSATFRVTAALAIFEDRLSPEILGAIKTTLHAFNAYATASRDALRVINGAASAG